MNEAPYTTKEKVKTTFAMAENIKNEILDLLISDAGLKVDIDQFPNSLKEQATRLYVCHLIIVKNQTLNANDKNVVLEELGPLKRQYAKYDGSKNIYNDRYQKLYDELLNSIGGNNFARFI